MLAPLLALTLVAGARVEVHPTPVVPGGILVVDSYGDHDPESLGGEVFGQKLHFFAAGPRHQRALVALKLDTKPGDVPFAVSVAGGRAMPAVATVAAKVFPKRELTVLSKFVSPPKSERAHIAEDKKEIAEAYDVEFGPALFVGGLSNPKPGAEVTAHFGDQRTYNGKKQSEHYGTDFDGKIGEPILAAADGEVVLARGCYMSGNTVFINHGGGLFTSYFHMSRMDVEDGEHVKRGQQLGLVGKTGRVTGPHLHFAVKVFSRLADAQEALKLQLGLDPPAGERVPSSPVPSEIQPPEPGLTTPNESPSPTAPPPEPVPSLPNGNPSPPPLPR